MPVDHSRPHGSTDRPIARQCTAKSKRSGQRCRKHAMRGRTVCLAHGGRTPRGTSSPHFRHGRYSRSLPGQLLAIYEKTVRDPRLLSLRDEIALTEAMIVDRLQDLKDDTPDGQRWCIFRKIGQLIDARRRLVETEVRHVVLAREVLTAEEAMTLVRAVVEVVTRYVPDPMDRAAVAEEISQLVDMDSGIPFAAHSAVRLQDP